MIERRVDKRRKYFLGFTFCFAALIGFLVQFFASNINAINPRYAGFDAGNIISDFVMSDYTSMSEQDIQMFLKSKNPCNDTNLSKATYYSWHNYHIVDGHFVCMADESFDGESAAHIIWQAAQDYHINPRVLIVLLEKEQGLVTDTWPNADLQYRSATGYGCPDTAACDSQYYGFRNQIRNAAELFRWILDYGSKYYPLGYNNVRYNPNVECGSSTIYISNHATAALYQYTPYQPNNDVLNSQPGSVVNCGAYGNINFYYYFTEWFGDTHYVQTSSYVDENNTFTFQTDAGLYIVPENNEMGAKMYTSNSSAAEWRNFKFERIGDFYVVRHVATNYVLDVAAAGTANGTDIQIWEFNGTCAQKWNLIQTGNGVALQSACSGKKLDVYGAYIEHSGIKIQLWEDNGSVAQHYRLTDLSVPIIADGTYAFETVSEKAMDIDGGGTWNGTRIHMYNLTRSPNQLFTVKRDTDGLYSIINVSSGRALDVAAAGTSNGSILQLWDYNATCAQKWIAMKNGDGYGFRSACSNRAIDIPSGLIWSVFQKLQIYDSNGSDAQKWILKTPETIEEGNYEIVSAVNGQSVIDITGGAENTYDGTNIQLYSPNNTKAQRFTIKYVPELTSYQIINSDANNRVLDVQGGSTNDGANVQMWGNNMSCAQLWRFRKNDDGTYNIISFCSDNVLDVTAGASKDGTNIQLWDYNGSIAQKWKLIKK